MAGAFHLNLSQLSVRPDPARGRLVPGLSLSARTSAQRSVIKASLELEKPVNPRLGAALDVLDISVTPPAVSVIKSPVVPMASHRSSDLTAAVGPTATGGLGYGINGSSGFYGSTVPEFGVFGSVGVVFGLFAGFGAGLEYTFIFGTPNDFAGPFLCFQASIGPEMFGGCAVGGSLLFSIGGPTPSAVAPLAFMGFTVNLTCGWSPFPVSATVEWSNTWIHPLIK